MKNDFTTNQLRALSAGILLILALASLFLKATNSTFDIILIALASFLVGGALLSKQNFNNNNQYEQPKSDSDRP